MKRELTICLDEKLLNSLETEADHRCCTVESLVREYISEGFLNAVGKEL